MSKANRNRGGVTFQRMLEQTRAEAAERVWQRAKLASTMRHAMRACGRSRSARQLGEIKRAAITRALELAPDQIGVTLDSDRYIGLVSVRWAGRGWLHLPAHVELPVPQLMPVKRSA